MPAENVAVFVYGAPADVAKTLGRLTDYGIHAESVSLICIDRETAMAPVAYHFESGTMRRTSRGGNWPSFGSLLTGCTVLVAPDRPAVVAAGPIGPILSRALENEVLFGNMGPIAGTLYSLGMPREAARRYESAAREGRWLMVIHGPARNVARAREVLR
jgi:hypothetical protein